MGILKKSLTILYIIGIIIFATVLALGTIFTYFPLQMFLFGRGDYLLLVFSNANMIPIFMIMILIIYALIRLKEKLFKRKEISINIIEDIEEPTNTEPSTYKEEFLFKLLNKLETLDDKVGKAFKVIKN